MNVVFDGVVHEVKKQETRDRFGLTYCEQCFSDEMDKIIDEGKRKIWTYVETNESVTCIACVGGILHDLPTKPG